jgi:hypothetical protein
MAAASRAGLQSGVQLGEADGCLSERLAELPRVAEDRHYQGVGYGEPMQPLPLVAVPCVRKYVVQLAQEHDDGFVVHHGVRPSAAIATNR